MHFNYTYYFVPVILLVNAEVPPIVRDASDLPPFDNLGEKTLYLIALHYIMLCYIILHHKTVYVVLQKVKYFQNNKTVHLTRYPVTLHATVEQYYDRTTLLFNIKRLHIITHHASNIMR